MPVAWFQGESLISAQSKLSLALGCRFSYIILTLREFNSYESILAFMLLLGTGWVAIVNNGSFGANYRIIC